MCVCVRVCVCAGGRLLPFCVVMCAQLALSGCGFGCGCGCGCGLVCGCVVWMWVRAWVHVCVCVWVGGWVRACVCVHACVVKACMTCFSDDVLRFMLYISGSAIRL